LILEGRVDVDRKVVTQVGMSVDPRRQEIRVDGEVLPRPRKIYLAVHKPPGVLSTNSDPAGRVRVIDLAPPGSGRLFCVGRLDRASEGLILLTNDGELANRLTHPRYGVEKTYLVEVAGRLDGRFQQQLERGVWLAEGRVQARRVRVQRRRSHSTVLEIVLAEGRNREIRRMLARLGHKVLRLARVAVGPVRLGSLPSGGSRRLSRAEVSALLRAASKPVPSGEEPAR
jgi:23S rRNA pseudouridine2605 synthase